MGHGRFYWICHNSLVWARACWEKRKRFFISIMLLAVVILAIARAWVQPLFLTARIYSFELIMFGFGLFILRYLKSRLRLRGWATVIGIVSVVGISHWYLHWQPHRYLTLYLRYQALDVKDLDEMPETDNERVQPLHSIRVQAKEAMTEVQQMPDPYFVRVDDSYRWTMSIEPSFFIPRLFGGVSEVVSVSATAAAPNFSYDSRHKVSFSVGEKLLFGKNAHIATVRSFGLARFLSYEPADVKYVKDDSGEWVELVSLIRWRGLIFPRPEFGGVQVIHQNAGGILHWFKLLFLGEGEWIPPEQVASHNYLRKQNLVPYDVGRYVADSFRFKNGFFAPFPGFHSGDIRIPDLPGDSNDQPFITYFRFAEGKGESKLYQYFSLEPYEAERQGLNTSVLLPTDNVGPILVYRHADRNEALVGVTTIPAKVRESRKMYDWSHSRPAENRPYIKKIAGKTRFMWLTTVVTYKSELTEGSDYIAGSMPEVVITDAMYRQVVWMNPQKLPIAWPEELKRELATVWKTD